MSEILKRQIHNIPRIRCDLELASTAATNTAAAGAQESIDSIGDLVTGDENRCGWGAIDHAELSIAMGRDKIAPRREANGAETEASGVQS